jgi:hypothetical protein
MVDDLTKRGQPHRARINVHGEHELRYRSEKFGVNRQQLRETVRVAGPTAKDIPKRLCET